MPKFTHMYRYDLSQDKYGKWQVRFPDLPEALTEADTEIEAHELAQDAMFAALEGLIKFKRTIPKPSLNGSFSTMVPEHIKNKYNRLSKRLNENENSLENSASLNIRITKDIRLKLEKQAKLEGRRLSNLVQKVLGDYTTKLET